MSAVLIIFAIVHAVRVALLVAAVAVALTTSQASRRTAALRIVRILAPLGSFADILKK